MLNKLIERVKLLLSPTVELVKHAKVGSGNVTYNIFFKAHFLSAWLNITAPDDKLVDLYPSKAKYYYVVAEREAERLGATFKTKETFSL